MRRGRGPPGHSPRDCLRRRNAKLTATLLASILTGTAAAQTQPQHWAWCLGADPGRKIAGCTSVIQDGQDIPENLATAYNGRGNAYTARREYDRAIQDYGEAIRLNPTDAGGFNNRGLAYAHQGQYDRAIQDYGEALRLNPYYARAFSNRGAALRALGQRDQAAADFARARKLNSSLPSPAD